MNFIHIKHKPAILGLAIGLALTGCQKMERPELKELILGDIIYGQELTNVLRNGQN